MLKRKVQSAYGLKAALKNRPAFQRFLILMIFLGVMFQPGLLSFAHAVETPPPVSGRLLSPESILPADVLARATLVLDELEEIRFVMGKGSQDHPLTYWVQNAAPREVYFQALTLLKKTNRLAVEQTGRMNPNHNPLSPKNIRPFDVWNVVNESLKRVLLVKKQMGIFQKVEERQQPDTTSPSDVFTVIVHVSRHVNLLLDLRFSPSDVYQEVTIAVRYASELLAFFPKSIRIMPDPPLEKGKRPSDVYQELLRAFVQVQKIIRLSGEKGVDIDTKSIQLAEITPSEVFDIASLLVSELAYLHASLLQEEHTYFDGYHPGRRFPSHVFQRTSILRAQLTELTRYVEKQPGWLKKR